MTVLPVPKPPGMAAVPPLEMGNRVSRILWPVKRGMSGMSFLFTGRPNLTGHLCIIMTSFPSIVAMVWSTVKSPLFISSTVPLMSLGTRMRWVMLLSGAVPMIWPPVTLSPFLTTGVKAYLALRSSPGAATPRLMKSPMAAISTGSGLRIPS